MVRIALASIIGLAAAVSASAQKDVVIIDDGHPPLSADQTFSGKCVNGRAYALEISQDRDGKARLSARHGGKVEPIHGATALSNITRADLYAVTVECGPSAATFDIKNPQIKPSEDNTDHSRLRSEGRDSIPHST